MFHLNLLKLLMLRQLSNGNTQIYKLSYGPYIIHFSAVFAKKRKYFEQIFALKRANTACRQQMATTNLIHKHF